MRDRVKTTLAAVVVAASLGLAGPATLAHADGQSPLKASTSQAAPATHAAKSMRIYHVTVRCAKVRIRHHHVVGRVLGHGRGRTRPGAVAAAVRDANHNAGRGYRAERCRVIRGH